MYTLNDKGEITHTHVMRVQEVRGRLRLGSVRKMDDARINEMLKCVRDLKQVNRDIWSFIGRLKAHMDEVRTKAPMPESSLAALSPSG
jgi:hypothetical protein